MTVKNTATNTVKNLASSVIDNISASSIKSSLFKALSGDDSPITYKNTHAYKSVLVYRAQRMAVQAASQVVTNALESGLNKLKSTLKSKLKLTENNTTSVSESSTYNVVQDTFPTDDSLHYGRKLMYEEKGSTSVVHTFYPRAINGKAVYESLILSYETEEPYTFYDRMDDTTYKTSTVLFYDLAPQIDVQSEKNVVLTKVQGRDYSRKELVAGGDMSFTVSGVMVDKKRGNYPAEQVKYFLDVMKYGGILSVNNILFNNYGVYKVLITGFSMQQPEGKNMQPYSFSCVAVESTSNEELYDTINAVISSVMEDMSTKEQSLTSAQAEGETASISDNTTNV